MAKILAFIIVFLVFMFVILGLIKQISRAIESSYVFDREADKVSKLQEENRKLKGELAKVSEYTFVEEVARNKLNMSKPEETVVIIDPKLIDDLLKEEEHEQIRKLPNWQGWIKLFLH